MARPRGPTTKNLTEKRLGNSELNEIVRSVLELPIVDRNRKEATIVRTIFEVMAKALRSGETIRINGLGTFKVKHRNGTRRLKIWVNGTKHRQQIETDVKMKNKVTFRPAENIIAVLKPEIYEAKRHREGLQRHVCDESDS